MGTKALCMAMLVLALMGCVTGKRLTPVQLDGPSEIEGTYTVYLYSISQYPSLEGNVLVRGAVAILDLEGDGYEFSLEAPKYDYGMVKGLSAEQAVRSALYFLGRHYGSGVLPFYGRIEVDGKAIGYEMRAPLKPWLYRRDTVDVEYFVARGGKVRAVFLTGPTGPGAPLY